MVTHGSFVLFGQAGSEERAQLSALQAKVAALSLENQQLAHTLKVSGSPQLRCRTLTFSPI